jgi:hypothetical protein
MFCYLTGMKKSISQMQVPLSQNDSLMIKMIACGGDLQLHG